jgi:long-chain-fatty-acid---luciferin-component ligase
MQNNVGVIYKRLYDLFGKPKNEWKTVDKMIFGMDDYFNTPKDITRLRDKAIIEAFKFHYDNNLFYNQFCNQRKISPQDIKSEKDFPKIPMMPDAFFKEYPSEKPEDVYKWLYQVSSVDIGKYDFNGKKLTQFMQWAEKRLNGLIFHSSGTSGKFSIVFRDQATMIRIIHALLKLVLFHITELEDNAHFVYPGSTKTFLTGGHAIGKASELFDDDHKHFSTDRFLSLEIIKLMSTGQAVGIKQKLEMKLIQKAMIKGQFKIINLLQELEKKNEQVVMITFPIQIWNIMEIMEKEGITMNLGKNNSFMISGGGWKIHAHKKVSEEDFARRIENYFGIPKENYRDLYGMSEMNGGALSCKERYKHLTDWIYPMVLDDNMEPVGFGESGRFAFLDPASYGYPGFIISGDRVKLLEECPKCDKTGIVIESEVTRMKGAEGRGCGNLMRELMAKDLDG